MDDKIVKKHIENCKATYNQDDIIIDFQGFGIIQKNILNLKEDIVKVRFSGKIGAPDFLFEIIK